MTCLGSFTRYCSGVTPLHAAALGGPIGKALQLVAILPGKLEKFGRGHVGRFLAKKGLKPPLQVWAVPRPQPVAPCRNPVKLNCLPHRSCLSSTNNRQPSGADRCSCTMTQVFPFFSQIPVYRTGVSIV